MSIYATIGEIGIRRFGDEGMIEILIQAVPAHIDYVGEAWEFLPPPVEAEGTTNRAVFFVERGTEKGTAVKQGQPPISAAIVRPAGATRLAPAQRSVFRRSQVSLP